jgi:hypothetical protein
VRSLLSGPRAAVLHTQAGLIRGYRRTIPIIFFRAGLPRVGDRLIAGQEVRAVAEPRATSHPASRVAIARCQPVNIQSTTQRVVMNAASGRTFQNVSFIAFSFHFARAVPRHREPAVEPL